MQHHEHGGVICCCGIRLHDGEHSAWLLRASCRCVRRLLLTPSHTPPQLLSCATL